MLRVKAPDSKSWCQQWIPPGSLGVWDVGRVLLVPFQAIPGAVFILKVMFGSFFPNGHVGVALEFRGITSITRTPKYPKAEQREPGCFPNTPGPGILI